VVKARPAVTVSLENAFVCQDGQESDARIVSFYQYAYVSISMPMFLSVYYHN